jgi:hypothetical protein
MSQQAWYVALQGTTYGPYSPAQLKDMAKNGQIDPNTQIMLSGQDKWIPAGKVSGLFAQAAAPQTAAPQSASSVPAGLPRGVAVPRAAVAAPRAVASPAAAADAMPAFPMAGVSASSPRTAAASRPQQPIAPIGPPVIICVGIGVVGLNVGLFLRFFGEHSLFASTSQREWFWLDVGIYVVAAVLSLAAIVFKKIWLPLVGGLASLGILCYRYGEIQAVMAPLKKVIEAFAQMGGASVSPAQMAQVNAQFSMGIGFWLLLLGGLALAIAPALQSFPKGADRKKPILISVVSILLIGGIAGGAGYFIMQQRMEPALKSVGAPF